MTTVKQIDGKPILDAKRPATLTINKNDIDKADIKEPADCAVARACRRVLHAKEVRVHLSRIYVRTNESNWTRYYTPQALRAEIISFDRGGAFEPGEYELVPIRPSHRQGKRQGGASKNKRPRSPAQKKRRSPHVVTNVRSGPA